MGRSCGQVVDMTKGKRLQTTALMLFGVFVPIIGVVALSRGHAARGISQILLGLFLLAYTVPRLRDKSRA